MSTGKFRLFYRDAAGSEVPLEGISYRVIRTSDGERVATGTTDAAGRTAAVRNAPREHAATDVAYRIELRDRRANAFIEPPLHRRSPASQLVVPGSGSEAPRESALQLQPFVEVVFQMQRGNQPVVGAPFIAYTQNVRGQTIVATDSRGQPIRGSTDARGSTGKHDTAATVWFEFSVPDTGITRRSQALTPRVVDGAGGVETVSLKSQSATTRPGRGNQTEVDGKRSAQAVLNAEDGELLLLTDQVWAEFEAMSGLIESTMANHHQARLDLTHALEARSPEQVARAQENLGLAEDRVDELLNQSFSALADLQEVVTFESYDRGRTHGDGRLGDRMGLRRRYIPRQRYEEMRQQRVKGIPYKLDFGDVSSPEATVRDGPVSAKTVPASDGGTERDGERFGRALERLTIGIRESWRSDPKVVDLIQLGANQFSNVSRQTESFEIDKSAQWLRFVGGAGASAQVQWDVRRPGQAHAQLSGNLQGKLVLFEGRWTPRMSLPSRRGWQMHFAGEDLGAIRFDVECAFYGFAGAKASLTGSLGISVGLNGGRAEVRPITRDRADRLDENFDTQSGLPRFEPTALNESVPSNIDGLSGRAEIFAGAEAGLTPSGELGWLPPRQRDFQTFAELSLDIAGSAGAGAGAQLHIYYQNGRFRIKAAARLCWGLGGKGAVDFVVDAGKVFEFVKWMRYQLLHAGFRQLVYMQRDAFEVLSQLLFAFVVQGLGVSEANRVAAFLREGRLEVDEFFSDLLARMDNARARSQMVARINQLPEWLIYATPETRGMLLHEITRHYPETHLRNTPGVIRQGWDWQAHFLPDHKEAILNILRPVTTWTEWVNVMQHMSARGEKRDNPGQAEGDVVRFLDYGWSLNNQHSQLFQQMNMFPRTMATDVGNRYLQTYLERRKALLDAFPKGHEVALQGTPAFEQLARLDGERLEGFAMVDPERYLPDGRAETQLA